MSDFGEVRAILHAPPDASAFGRLCAMLDDWDDPVELADQVLPYCHSHLERWPDEVRLLPSAMAWALACGESPVSVPFARSAKLLFSASQTLEPAFESGLLRQMRILRIEKARMSPHEARVIGEADLPHLASLDLGVMLHRGMGTQGAAALASLVPQLRLLNLNNCRVGDGGVRALFTQPVEALVGLSLASCNVGDDGVRALASASWPALECLDLSRDVFGSAAFEALLSSGAMPSLVFLRATSVPLDVEAVRAIPHTLRELTLSPPVGVDDLIEALPHDHWTSITLLSGDASARGARALARRDLSMLEQLRLYDQRLGDEGAQVLSQAAFPALTVLSLRGNDLGAQGAAALTQAPWFGSVRELNLGSNPIEDEGVISLCQSDLSSLRVLSLKHCGVGRRGAEALASCPGLANLESLSINLRRSEPRAALALATSPHLPTKIRERWRAIAER